MQVSNSITGLVHEQHRHGLNHSVDHGQGGGNTIHSQSQNYPLNFASGEIIGQNSQNRQKEDLLASDEVLHEYPEMPTKKKFIKSVDEGTFSKMKQGRTAENSATMKERGSSHNTIEHPSSGQLNPVN